TFRWYASHLTRVERGVVSLLRPFAGRLLKTPAEVMEALRRLDEATAELRARLSDPEVTSYRVVVQPERMVVREAERAISYLGLFNYPVDSVIINRILPEDGTESEFYQQRRALQEKYLEIIEATFSPLPLWTTPYYPYEVVGLDTLRRLALDTFGDEDPGEIFYQGMVQEVVEGPNDTFLLRLPLPFVEGGKVRLRKRGDEMFITIGNFKREMILPNVLAKRRAGSGRLVDGVLEIEFLPAEHAEDPEP
ncbi:MAG: ArsA family ATPase, partial [Anaerolineae bacterium]|nr:ArsA family ATPase [Anaerolineae bacterium]